MFSVQASSFRVVPCRFCVDFRGTFKFYVFSFVFRVYTDDPCGTGKVTFLKVNKKRVTGSGKLTILKALTGSGKLTILKALKRTGKVTFSQIETAYVYLRFNQAVCQFIFTVGNLA